MEKLTDNPKSGGFYHSNIKPIDKWITENFIDLETLHETNLSTAYEARDKTTNDQVFLQVTKVNRSATYEVFKAGITANSKLSAGENILRIEKSFYDEKRHEICYSTKLGKTLQDILNTGAPLSMANAIQLLKNLVKGLLYAKQTLNISHNNLKPSNIVYLNGVEHLGGWERSLTSQDQHKKITRDMLFYNDCSFQAPEMTRGSSLKNIDLSKADVYSLGLIFLFARGIPEMQVKSLQCSPMITSNLIAEAFRSSNFDQSKKLKLILIEMLAKAPYDRISLEALKDKLNSITTQPAKSEEEEFQSQRKLHALLQAAHCAFSNRDYVKSLDIYETCLSEFKDLNDATERSLYAHCLIGIGNVFNRQGQLEEAFQKYSEAQRIFNQKVGNNHADIATCLFNKATILTKQNAAADAIHYFEESMMLFSVAYGTRSSKVADCMIGIGDVYYTQGKEDEALKRYYDAIDIKKKKCREFLPDIAECYSKVADIFKNKELYLDSLNNYEKSLTIYKNYYGTDHFNVAMILNNIGVILKKMGRMQESLKKYEESMDIYLRTYGKWNPKVADCLYNMAINLKCQGEIDKALEKYDESLEIYRECCGDFHSEVVIVLEAIDNLIKSRAQRYHRID